MIDNRTDPIAITLINDVATAIMVGAPGAPTTHFERTAGAATAPHYLDATARPGHPGQAVPNRRTGGAGQRKGQAMELTRLRGRWRRSEVEEWRITLHTLSVLDKSRHFAHVRTVEPWLDEMFSAQDGETNPERATLTITAHRGAGPQHRRHGETAPVVLDGDSRDGWEAR